MRPATLDRVENGGPGSDINPHERRPKGANSTTARSSGPRLSSLPPCSKLYKARPGNGGACLDDGAMAGLDSLCARRRPKSTVAAEESLRRGRTKETTQERKKKRLRLWRRLENERMVARQSNKRITPARYATSDGTSGSGPNLRIHFGRRRGIISCARLASIPRPYLFPDVFV